MKAIRYLADWYAVNGGGNSFVQYAAGQTYPVSDDSDAHVGQGHAEYVEVPDPAPVEVAPEAPAPAVEPAPADPAPVDPAPAA